MTILNRREVLKGALGAFASWTSARVLSAQQAFGAVRRLTDQMTVVDGGGSNVLAFFTGDGFVLVDGGVPLFFVRPSGTATALGGITDTNGIGNAYLERVIGSVRRGCLDHLKSCDWQTVPHAPESVWSPA